jgi:hypothetical protein
VVWEEKRPSTVFLQESSKRTAVRAVRDRPTGSNVTAVRLPRPLNPFWSDFGPCPGGTGRPRAPGDGGIQGAVGTPRAAKPASRADGGPQQPWRRVPGYFRSCQTSSSCWFWAPCSSGGSHAGSSRPKIEPCSPAETGSLGGREGQIWSQAASPGRPYVPIRHGSAIRSTGCRCP